MHEKLAGLMAAVLLATVVLSPAVVSTLHAGAAAPTITVIAFDVLDQNGNSVGSLTITSYAFPGSTLYVTETWMGIPPETTVCEPTKRNDGEEEIWEDRGCIFIVHDLVLDGWVMELDGEWYSLEPFDI